MAELFCVCAARLNDEGIYFHEAGDDDSAFAAFKDALESLAITGKSNEEMLISTPQIPKSNSFLDQPIFGCDDDPFLYDRNLSFNHDDAQDPDKNQYCRAIVVFNMALVYSKRDKDKETLHKALFLYSMCLQHVQASSDQVKRSDVVLAAMNNQAVVLYLMEDFGKARRVLNEMWAMLKQLRSRPASFVKQDIHGFVHNILLLLHSPSLAPAA